MYLFQVGIIWSEVACVVSCIIVGFYHLWFGGGKRKEAVDWGKFNKIRRISQVSLPLSLNSFPPYQEPRYINLHVMDKESCVLQISVFNGCDLIIHLEETERQRRDPLRGGCETDSQACGVLAKGQRNKNH